MKNKVVAFTRRTLTALARRAPLSRDLFRALDASEQARIAAVTKLDNLEKVARPAAAPSSPLPIPKFWEKNYWEPTVQFPIRDYCRPGDVVFDVGANAGALSMLMSRLVGPRGTVCAFEASPRIVAITLDNLVSGGCSNVQLYHRAIYHTSHQPVAIYAGLHLNDSLYPTEVAKGDNFQTVDRWTKKEVHCVYQALIVAIATRHADAVDIKFLVDGRPVWVALPHPAWVEYKNRTGKVITDQLAIEVAGHYLKTALESGEGIGREMYSLGVDETLRHLESVVERSDAPASTAV